MSSLAEIERAVEALPPDQLEHLFVWLSGRLRYRQHNNRSTHGVLDIAPVSLGRMVRPLDRDDDLLGEMLEDRQ